MIDPPYVMFVELRYDHRTGAMIGNVTRHETVPCTVLMGKGELRNRLPYLSSLAPIYKKICDWGGQVFMTSETPGFGDCVTHLYP